MGEFVFEPKAALKGESSDVADEGEMVESKDGGMEPLR